MSTIVSIHSFRGGTGKSNVTANLAAITAGRGKRVGVVDTDIQSPGIHVLFGFDEERVQRSLNDYLWERCAVEDAAYDVTAALGPGATGKIFLIPSSLKAGEIAKILRQGYDVRRLTDGLHALIKALDLDVLFIDTHPGVNEETLLSMAISDFLLLVLRADQQDYQGTAVTVDLARRLEVSNMLMLVNKVLPEMDVALVRKKVEDAYGVPVAGVLPLSEDLVRLGSSDLFTVRFPDHQVTRILREVAGQVAG